MRNVNLKNPEQSTIDPWGYASDKTGLRHDSQGRQFRADHPIGTQLKRDDLLEIGKTLFTDLWNKRGGLGAHEVAGFLRDAGTHPRMGEDTFDLYYDRTSGNYVVIDLLDSIDNSEPVSRALQTLNVEVGKLNQRLRGAQLTPENKQLIKRAYAQITDVQKTLQLMVFNEALSIADAVRDGRLGNGHQTQLTD